MKRKTKKNKTKKKPIKFIYNDTYNVNIWYFKGWTREEMRQHLKKTYNYDVENRLGSDSAVLGSVWELPIKDKESGDFIVYCLYLQNQDYSDVIAHEALHITSSVFRRIGMNLLEETEEAYCYFMQWLTGKIIKS